MTRGFTFILFSHIKVYNLWTDLIVPTITDQTFGNSPFIPADVKSFRAYFPLNNANNTGNNASIIRSGVEVKNLIPGDDHVESFDKTVINLKGISLQGSADNVAIEILIID